MKITEITYSASQKIQIKQYESRGHFCSATASLDEGEDTDECYGELKKLVNEEVEKSVKKSLSGIETSPNVKQKKFFAKGTKAKKDFANSLEEDEPEFELAPPISEREDAKRQARDQAIKNNMQGQENKRRANSTPFTMQSQ